MKIDSSNKNNARSDLKQLMSERETSDRAGMHLEIGRKYISGCHILCLGSIYSWGMAEN